MTWRGGSDCAHVGRRRSSRRKGGFLGRWRCTTTSRARPATRELRLIETAADIARIAIEQHRAHQALRQSEARNEAILRAIPDWMFLATVDGVFLDYHARDVSKLHVPPSAFLGRRIRDVLPPPIGEALAQAFARAGASGEAEKVEYTIGSDDAEQFFEACIVRCDSDTILSIVRDITDRKRAELEADAHRRELAHLSRVSMLGELTGALAHELSQPLTAVLSNAQAARRLLDWEPLDVGLLRATLDDIIRNDKRAGAVIDRLRALLRKGRSAVQPVDVNEMIREVIDLAYGELTSRRVAVKSVLTTAIPLVLGDRVQLQQVVLNLMLNACDVMTGATRGAEGSGDRAGRRWLRPSSSCPPRSGNSGRAARACIELFVTFREDRGSASGWQSAARRARRTAARSGPRTTRRAGRHSAASCH